VPAPFALAPRYFAIRCACAIRKGFGAYWTHANSSSNDGALKLQNQKRLIFDLTLLSSLHA
jgi:hypothetical protein